MRFECDDGGFEFWLSQLSRNPCKRAKFADQIGIKLVIHLYQNSDRRRPKAPCNHGIIAQTSLWNLGNGRGHIATTEGLPRLNSR